MDKKTIKNYTWLDPALQIPPKIENEEKLSN